MMEAKITRGERKKKSRREKKKKKCDGNSLGKEIIIKVKSKEIGRFRNPEKTLHDWDSVRKGEGVERKRGKGERGERERRGRNGEYYHSITLVLGRWEVNNEAE